MFSKTTMASSTTKPTARVSAMSERLSIVYPSKDMAANVPTMDSGSARLGMIVAEIFRKNRKITKTTRVTASTNVNLDVVYRLADGCRTVIADV